MDSDVSFKLISPDGKLCYVNTTGCEDGYQQNGHAACMKYCEVTQVQNNNTHQCEFCPIGKVALNGFCIQEASCNISGGLVKTINQSEIEFIGNPGANKTNDKYCWNDTNAYADELKYVTSCPSTVHSSFYDCPDGTSCVLIKQQTTPAGRCVECQQGTYATNNKCEVCSAGSTTNGSNQTSCSVTCNSGFITNSKGQCVSQCGPTEYQQNNQCVGCDVGNQATTTQCNKCPKSYYRSAANTTCQRCNNNMTTTEDGAIYQQQCWVTCPANQFINHIGECVAQCPVGSFTVANSTYCQTCDQGQEYNATTQKCQQCPKRYYKSIFNVTCQQCPNQSTTSQVGSIDISNCTIQCNASQYLALDGSCVQECGPREKVQNKECILCNASEFVSNNRSNCLTACPTGSAPDILSFVCTPCPAGTMQITQNGQSICQTCPLGTISQASATSCNKCAAGQYVTNNTCTKCGTNGSFVLDDYSGCVMRCPDGQTPDQNLICQNCSQYISANGLLCQAKCPSGQGILATTYNDNVSALPRQSAKQCSVCPAGMYGNVNTNMCQKCAEGTYSSQSGQSQCTRCKPGFASKPDFTGCVNNCQNGYVMQDGVCLPCASGQISVNNECQYCPAMSIPTTDLGSCIPCGLREYAQPGDTLCKSCSNFISSTLDGCVDVCGKYEYVLPGGFQCIECPPGAYPASATSKTGYVQCPVAQAVSIGADECVDTCQPGQFLDSKRRCIQCPAGSVSSGNGTACTECGQLAQPDEKQQTCLKCAPWQVSNAENGFMCQLCSEGTYYSDANASCLSTCNKNEQPSVVEGAPICVKCKSFYISDGLQCVQDVAKVRLTALSVGIPVGLGILIGLIVGIICCIKAKKRASQRTVTTAQAQNISMSTPITFTYDEVFDKSSGTKIVY